MLIRPPTPEEERPLIADEKAVATLEFDKVRARLAEHASNSMGKALCLEIEPTPHLPTVRLLQQETTEARIILRAPSDLPLGGIHDIRGHVRRCVIGAALDPPAFNEIHDTIRAAHRLRKHLMDFKVDAPLIAAMGEGLGTFRPLESSIANAISEQGEVLDRASRDLERLRREKRLTQERVREKLDSLVHSDAQKFLQDPIVTLRGDRFVVPVKYENRANVPGVVHDQSASGQTLFVEPLAVLELNNRLREIEVAEQEEVRRILRQLASEVAAVAGDLSRTVTDLGRLDFIFAKGKYSEIQQAHEPVLNDEGRMNLIKARHPLLRGAVVPVDIPLGRDFDIMLVTGPNTGGKTVSLKTAGLMALMAMSGLHLPASSGSEMSVFGRVFADIGDEQSIEQSLSTFSSHMTNIIRILRDVGHDSLVLLDELGAGTDPVEGSALAMAILEYLSSTGAKVAATTHYGALKAFAYSRPRIANASVEFDADSLRPTYRLLVGLPGRSNAFLIAGRLGLPAEIVDRAREFLTKEDVRVEDLIESMETDRFVMERERVAAENLRASMEVAKAEIDRRSAEARRREREILDKAQEQAQRVLQKVRQQADEALRLLKTIEKESRQQERAKALEEARRILRESQRDVDEAVRGAGGVAAAAGGAESGGDRGAVAGGGREGVVGGARAAGPLRPGQSVYIESLNQKGILLSLQDDQALVQVGIMKVQRPVVDLAPLTEDGPGSTSAAGASGPGAGGTGGTGIGGAGGGYRSVSTGNIAGQKAQTFSPEIDLRGLTVEEAAHRLDKYMDDAFLAGAKKVFIIHGKGTGALRKGLLELLSADPRIRSHRPGAHGEGGMGVTVAELTE